MVKTRIKYSLSIIIFDMDGNTVKNDVCNCETVEVPISAAASVDLNDLAGSMVEEAMSQYEDISQPK